MPVIQPAPAVWYFPRSLQRYQNFFFFIFFFRLGFDSAVWVRFFLLLFIPFYIYIYFFFQLSCNHPVICMINSGIIFSRSFAEDTDPPNSKYDFNTVIHVVIKSTNYVWIWEIVQLLEQTSLCLPSWFVSFIL